MNAMTFNVQLLRSCLMSQAPQKYVYICIYFNIAYFLALLTCCKEHVRLCVCSPCAVHRVSFLASFIATLAKKGGPTPTVRHSDIRAPVARCTY